MPPPENLRGDFLQNQIQTAGRALRCAFPYTIPIFAGFWFLGLTYGIYMNLSGFSFWYPMLMSLTIFAGSMEFITVNMLLGAFEPVQVYVLCDAAESFLLVLRLNSGRYVRLLDSF